MFIKYESGLRVAVTHQTQNATCKRKKIEEEGMCASQSFLAFKTSQAQNANHTAVAKKRVSNIQYAETSLNSKSTCQESAKQHQYDTQSSSCEENK